VVLSNRWFLVELRCGQVSTDCFKNSGPSRQQFLTEVNMPLRTHGIIRRIDDGWHSKISTTHIAEKYEGEVFYRFIEAPS